MIDVANLDASSGEQARVCRSIDWYAEGQSKTVSINGEQIVVRYVGRKGRRGRICITAPAGVVFRGDMGTP